MDINTYRLLHIIGIAALFIGLGGMFAAGEDASRRKIFGMWHGIGLLIILISGFGNLAKLHLGFPLFAMVKTGLWLALGALPVLARKKILSPGIAIGAALVLAAILAWIGLNWATLVTVKTA